MEQKRDEEQYIKDHIRRLVTPIFDKILQETSSNSMTTPKKLFKILWRPNNYRRKIAVKTKDNSTIKKIKSAISTINFNSHTKLISIKHYKGITIQYGRNILTGIFSQNIINGYKETYLIESESIEELEERINQKVEEIQAKIDSALNSFIEQFNLKLPFEKPSWDRYEDWIKGDDFIDKIPREVIIHDTYFKKVYGEGIEFKQTENKEKPSVHLKNYIKNRAIEDIAPEVCQELSANRDLLSGIIEANASTSKLLNQYIRSSIPILQDFSINIKTHNKVLKGIDKSFKKFNKLLSKSNQTKLGDFS